MMTLCAQAIPFAEGRYMLLPSPLIFLKVANAVFLISFVAPPLTPVGLQVLCSSRKQDAKIADLSRAVNK